MVVKKIKDAGIIVGAHFWYNKAMKEDRYVTPVPDYRLNLSRTFTLAMPLDKASTTVTVEEDPAGCTLDNGRRILKIGNELIEYMGYTNERPYRFTGCTRGALKTVPSEYSTGFSFGLLDVDTWTIWVRFDQRTSIQQEVAERIGKIYNEAGFQFAYYDGAEDIPPPYWYNVSLPQLKVYNCLNPAPLFSEGACKSHFSWHILTRGNAFDVFSPEVIKKATREHPIDGAAFTARDFTSINFGWLNYLAPTDKSTGMQPDMYEYICCKAAAWDCPISLEGKLDQLKVHPRTADNLEVMRRWEEARINKIFSEEQKAALKSPLKEYTLLINEKGKLELQPYQQIADPAGGNPNIRAFIFTRSGKTYVVYWHTSGEGYLKLEADKDMVHLFREFGYDTPIQVRGKAILIPLGERRYLQFDLPANEVISIIKKAKTEQELLTLKLGE
jgi:hypothetical protein